MRIVRWKELATVDLAVNVSGEDPFDAEQDVTQWLPKPLPEELLILALRAVEEATASGGPGRRAGRPIRAAPTHSAPSPASAMF